MHGSGAAHRSTSLRSVYYIYLLGFTYDRLSRTSCCEASDALARLHARDGPVLLYV